MRISERQLEQIKEMFTANTVECGPGPYFRIWIGTNFSKTIILTPITSVEFNAEGIKINQVQTHAKMWVKPTYGDNVAVIVEPEDFSKLQSELLNGNIRLLKPRVQPYRMNFDTVIQALAIYETI